MSIALNKKSQDSIYTKTGMTVDEIINTDFDEVDKKIEKKIGRKLKDGDVAHDRLIGRGQPYLYLNRMLTSSFADKILKRMK